MDCTFCNVRKATNLQVPTMLGTISDLCDSCWKNYGPRGRLYEKLGRASDLENEKSGPAKTAPILNPTLEGFDQYVSRNFTT